jgi:predicted HicB family RNase H-like nuclease
MVQMTLRLPDDLHEWLRGEAHMQRTSITALIVAAVKQAREQAGEAV